MKRRGRIKLIVFAAAAVAVLILNHMFGWSQQLNGTMGIAYFHQLAADNIWLAAFSYIAFTVIGCVLLALPGVSFAILAGAMFGPVLGTMLCSAATTIGASASFLVGRFFLKDSIKPKIEKHRYIKKLLFDESENNIRVILMITRLVPLFPYNLQNFAYGITNIRFRTYTFYSFLFMLPGTILFTFGTAGFLTVGANKWVYLGVTAVLGIFVIGVSSILKKRYVKEHSEDRVDIKGKENACIHCGKCQQHCDFLAKYDLDLGDVDRLRKLAYHCFLCGKCKKFCPMDIDGRALVLELRQKQVQENGGQIKENGYVFLMKEKHPYLFKNYRHETSRTVLFPGCNFPSFFPKTTRLLAGKLFAEEGIGTIYDCCGKPIAELGLEAEEQENTKRMNEHFLKAGIEEIITVCPNCYYYLKPRLQVQVTDIYEKLKGYATIVPESEINLFSPCPDKAESIILRHLVSFLPEKINHISEVQCCGLGGCAAGKEPELSSQFAKKLQNRGYDNIYTYCASCSGKLTREGCRNVYHILVELMGTGERPDIHRSIINRARSKLW